MLSFDIDEVRRIAHEEAAKICPPLDEESFKRLARELEANDRELVEEVSSITGIDRRHLMGPLRLVSRAERIEELLDEEARFEQEITSPEWVERFNDSYVRARRNKAIGKIVALNSTNELGRYTGTTSVVHPDTEILYVDNLAAYSKPDRKAVQGHEKTHRGQF